MEQKSAIKESHFEIEIGTTLQIQVGEFYSRMESTLVGIHQKKYLVITMPETSIQAASELSKEGQPLIVRYICKGKAYGFKTVVLSVLTNLEKLLVISYPEFVEVYELRDYPRLNCFLPARIFLENQVIDSSVADISRTGVQYTLSGDNDFDNLSKHIDDELHLEVQLPGSEGYTQINGNLSNIRKNSNTIALGIRFDDNDTNYLTNLLSFLLDAQALPEQSELSNKIHKHYSWIEKVSSFIHSNSDSKPDFSLSPDECSMGQWLSNEGKNKYDGIEEIQELEKVHRDLHRQVAKVVDMRCKGQKEASIRKFNGLNIRHLSHKISALLIVAEEKKGLVS